MLVFEVFMGTSLHGFAFLAGMLLCSMLQLLFLLLTTVIVEHVFTGTSLQGFAVLSGMLLSSVLQLLFLLLATVILMHTLFLELLLCYVHNNIVFHG